MEMKRGCLPFKVVDKNYTSIMTLLELVNSLTIGSVREIDEVIRLLDDVINLANNYISQQEFRDKINHINDIIEDPNKFRNLRSLYNLGEPCSTYIEDLQSTARKTLNFVDGNPTRSQIIQGLEEIKGDLKNTQDLLRN